jgi:protease YdgD
VDLGIDVEKAERRHGTKSQRLHPAVPDANRRTGRASLRDVVLIVLRDDLTNIAPLELDRAEVQSSDISVVQASYPADRRYVLSGHFGCHLLARTPYLWFTDCDTNAGSSGGPVFIQSKEGLKLAAIMVGVAERSGSVAVPVRNWIDVVTERNCP